MKTAISPTRHWYIVVRQITIKKLTVLQKFQLRSLAATPALEDPAKYVHYIPWDNLQLVHSEELTGAEINLDDPLNCDIAHRRFALWSPPHPGLLWNHHLYTEDQVFNLNAQMNWSFPDHHKDGKVIYSIRELQGTDFINTLSDYWELWVSTDKLMARKAATSNFAHVM